MLDLGCQHERLRPVLSCLCVILSLALPTAPSFAANAVVLDRGANATAAPRPRVRDRIEDVAQTVAAEGQLSDLEFSRAIREIGYLSTFFGRLATNEAADFDGARWEELRRGYATAAGTLMRLRDAGAISIADLPPGIRGEVRGEKIVVDKTLNGEWLSEAVRTLRRESRDDWIHVTRLSTLLMEALAGLEGYAGWTWFDAQAAQSGLRKRLTSVSLENAGPLLVRYWFIRDRFLWSSVSAKAADEEKVRDAWKSRSDLLIADMDELLRDVGKRLGEDWQTTLGERWAAYGNYSAEVADAFSGSPLLSAEAAAPVSESVPTTAADRSAGRAQIDELAAVEERIAELESQLTRLRADLQTSRKQTSQLEIELQSARDEVSETKAAAGAFAKSDQDTAQSREPDGEKITDLEQELRDLQTDVNARAEQARKLEAALTSVREEAASIDAGPSTDGDLLESQARGIAAERQRVADLEQRLNDLGSELSASRSEAARYRQEIDSNRGKIARYEEQIQSTADELARYRAQLDAAQDRRRGTVATFFDKVAGDQAAVVVLAGVLLILSILSFVIFARRGLNTSAVPQEALNGLAATGPGNVQSAAPGHDRQAGRAESPDTAEADLEERRARSEAIAQDESASQMDVRALAYDDIEVALPVLVKSEALSDDDLIDVIHKTTNQHRLAIAIRKAVSARVAETLVETGDSKVIAALLENSEAEIPSAVLKELARRANQVTPPKAIERKLSGIPLDFVEGLRRPLPPSDRGPVADLPGNPRPAAEPQTAVVSKQHDLRPRAVEASGPVSMRRKGQPDSVTKAAPTKTAPAGAATGKGRVSSEGASARDRRREAEADTGGVPPNPAAKTGDGAQPASGDVSPSTLIEALRQGKVELFEALFSKLTGLRPPRVKEVLYGSGGEELAIVCRALGLDKPLMTSIFIWSRKGHPEFGQINPRELSHAMTVFDEISLAQAKDTANAWLVNPDPAGRWNGAGHEPAAE